VAKIGRPGLPKEQRQLVWDLWKSGSSISAISREVGAPPGSVFTILEQNGGFYSPAQKRRASHLTEGEREEISRGLAAGEGVREISRRLGRDASVISREISRNKGASKYRAGDADDRAYRLARRPKPCKLALNSDLRDYVDQQLREDWSPEQIAATLKKCSPVGKGVHVSHETIYKSLFIQSRGVLGKDLQQHLRSGRPIRRNVHNTTTKQWRSQIPDAVSIHDRPKSVDQRRRAGNWEGDFLLGRGLTQIATIVDRKTRMTLLVQLDGRDMHTVTEGISREMNKLPNHLRASLTWDRGMELADHKNITTNTGLKIYFADPRSPWQRGTNENTNRLLRQYMPKGVSMKHLTQDDLDAIADKLNNRPRKVLDYDTPANKLRALLH